MVKVKIDIGGVESAAIAAFKDACYFAHAEMIKTISDPGAFDDFPGQDIVDTGALRSNQQPPEFSDDGTKGTFRNTVDYAYWVYNGYEKRNGEEQPGRQWMDTTLERINFEQTFEKLFKGRS
jgi:hypothetical protein